MQSVSYDQPFDMACSNHVHLLDASCSWLEGQMQQEPQPPHNNIKAK